MEQIKVLADQKTNENRLSEDELRVKHGYFDMTED